MNNNTVDTNKSWVVYAENKVDDLFSIDLEAVGALIKTCLVEIKPSLPDSVSEVSIVFTNDSELYELNKNYRDKDSPTDVLSFSQLEGDENPKPISLGDIIVSAETAKRQAPEFNNDFNSELKRLVVHGLLHLLGYDHENVSKEEAQDMFTKQDGLLTMSAKISLFKQA